MLRQNRNKLVMRTRRERTRRRTRRVLGGSLVVLAELGELLKILDVMGKSWRVLITWLIYDQEEKEEDEEQNMRNRGGTEEEEQKRRRRNRRGKGGG